MSAPVTVDKKRQERKDRRERDFARQLQDDLVVLLRDVRFRRYMAHLCYGRLGLKRGGAWRRDSEIHKEAARRDVAAEVLGELSQVAPEGFVLLEQEHIHRMAEELRVAVVTEESTDE